MPVPAPKKSLPSAPDPAIEGIDDYLNRQEISRASREDPTNRLRKGRNARVPFRPDTNNPDDDE